MVDFLEEQLDGQLTHPIPRQTDTGHGDAALRGEVIVVVADDHQLIGYPDAKLGCRLDHPNGEQI